MKITNIISSFKNLAYQINSILEKSDVAKKEIESSKVLTGKLFSELNKQKTFSSKLEDYEFKVFSQWGDDGIIQHLINNIEISNKTFIEFGVENYTEANTKFLLINNNWSGLIFDGSEKHMESVINSDLYWKYNLTAKDEFITAENINGLIAEQKFDREVGLLHIDIDGNDYWVWKSINLINPIIVIVEFNSVFGAENPWTIPYHENFFRNNAHHSNLFYGVSILSLCDLAEEKGYDFIGCNSAGNNAYFIRKDKMGNFKKLTAQEGYVNSMFSESRNERGELTFLRGKTKINALKGMEIFDTRRNKLVKIDGL